MEGIKRFDAIFPTHKPRALTDTTHPLSSRRATEVTTTISTYPPDYSVCSE